MKRIFALVFCLLSVAGVFAFGYREGRASLSPYPPVERLEAYPDSLTPVFVNHVGRHGSRYPAGSLHTMMMKESLMLADSLRTITPLGKRLLKEVDRVIGTVAGRWGELDTIGELELRNIAERMRRNYPQLFDSAKVVAVSSPSSRCVLSMYSFAHQLAMSAKPISLSVSSGDSYTPLVRFFDVDETYLRFRADTAYTGAYKRFLADNITIDPLLRVLGEDFPLDYDMAYDLALAEYYVAAGMNAMGLDFDPAPYFTVEEYRKLWSVFNFRQYLLYSASTVSAVPVEMAEPLLQDIVATADSVISGRLDIQAKFRFGHAETLMPLMALIEAPGCFYLTNYFDTVADNWKDYEMFPMAANLQLVYFKAPSGEVYVRADYNERPIRLLPDEPSLYVKWDDLRSRLLAFLPLL